MEVICLTSIKGGVSKTTSTVNLAHGLAATGRRVLVIDCDHQCNSTIALLDSMKEDPSGTFYDIMMHRRPAIELIQRTPFENIDIIQGSMWMSDKNTELAGQYRREEILSGTLEGITGYHYVLIDTAPNTELVTVNAWMASTRLVVVLTPSKFAMSGVRILERQLAKVAGQVKRKFPLLGVLIALNDNTRKSRLHVGEIKDYFKDKVFDTIIPKNVQVEEATDSAASLYDFAPSSTGANAYASLVEEFINRVEGGVYA